MSLEHRSLIQQTDKFHKKENSIPLKYATILPAVLFLSFGLDIHTYVVNEWTQYKIRTDHFPNMSSVHNFSACSDTNHSDENYKHYKTVQQKSAKWYAIYNTAHHIPMVFATLILPSMTDTRGRRFLFVIIPLGSLFRYCLLPVIIYFKLSFIFITAAYAIDGLTGSSYALYSSVFSYIADITSTDNQRVRGIVFLEIVLVVRSVIASLLSGYLIDTWKLGYFYTSLISVFISFIGFFIFGFLVPESLNEKNRQKPKSFLTTLKRSTEFYYSAQFKGRRLCYILLLLCFTFAMLSEMNRSAMETLYLLGQPFCWGPSQIGVYSMARHAIKGVAGLSSLLLCQKVMSNQAIAAISTISNTAAFIVEAFATTNLMIYMVPVAGMFSFLLIPMLRGLMSMMTDTDKQGALFAGLSFMEVFCSIASSYLQNSIYAASLSFMNGFIFLVLACFSIIDFTMLIAYCCVKPYNSIKPEVKTYNSVHNTNV